MIEIEFAKNWQHLAKLPSKRQGHTLVMVGTSSVAVVGGYDPETSEYLNNVDVWDTRTRVWTNFQLREPRGGCAAVAIGSRLYVVGGYNNEKKRLSSLEMIDLGVPNAESILLTPMNQSRDECVAVVCQKKYIIVVGGRDRTSCLDTVEMYDTENHNWTDLEPMLEKRRLLAAGSSDRFIVVAGGHNGSKTLSSAEVYDMETQTWTKLPSMKTARHTCGGTVIPMGESLTFVVAGGSGHSSVEAFDSKTKTWSKLSGLAEISGACKLTMVDDQVFAAGEASLVALRFIPGGISNDVFTRRILGLANTKDLVRELSDISVSLARLPQLQMFYSTVNVQFMLGVLTHEQRRDIIVQALDRCAVMCTSQHHGAFYAAAVMKALLDGVIDEVESTQFKDKAEAVKSEGNDFLKEQRDMLKANIARLEEYESVKEAVYNNVLDIWNNVDVMRRSNQAAQWTREVLQEKLMSEQEDVEDSKKKVVVINDKMKRARAKRVEAGTSFCAALLSIVFMTTQNGKEGPAATLFGRVVDFSDVQHIYNVIKTVNNSRALQDSFVQGLAVAKDHDDAKLMEAVQKEAAIALIGASVGFVSETYDSTTALRALQQKQEQADAMMDTRDDRPEVIERVHLQQQKQQEVGGPFGCNPICGLFD